MATPACKERFKRLTMVFWGDKYILVKTRVSGNMQTMKRDTQAKVVKSQSLMPPIAMLGTLVRACAGAGAQEHLLT